MLRELEQEEFATYVDFAYSLASDLEKSVYPTYADGLKTKSDFVERARKAYQRENEEILLFEADGTVEGWIHYYALKEDNYLSFCSFNIANGVERAIDEFISYAELKYSGCTVYFGFAKQNERMRTRLEELAFEKQEECNVDVLCFDTFAYLPEECETIKVMRENYSEFAALHKMSEEDMYWNSERMLEKLEEWNIYLLYKAGKVNGAIYFCSYGTSMEIFGIDYAEQQYDERIFKALLIKALNEGKRLGMTDLTYFNDDAEHAVIEEMGFRHVSKYVLYTKELV